MIYTDEMLMIAKFMGLVPIKSVSKSGSTYYYYNDKYLGSLEGLPFYNTFDEIMPVVIKIEQNVDCSFIITKNSVILNNKKFTGVDKLDSIIKAVNWWITRKQKNTLI